MSETARYILRSTGGKSKGRLFHAVDHPANRAQPLWARALCGARPRAESGGWARELGSEVTCQVCIERLAAEARRKAKASADAA